MIDLQAIVLEGLIHGSRAVFKLHAVGESRAAATHNAHAKAGGNGSLLSHDLLHLGDGGRGEGERSVLNFRSWLWWWTCGFSPRMKNQYSKAPGLNVTGEGDINRSTHSGLDLDAAAGARLQNRMAVPDCPD